MRPIMPSSSLHDPLGFAKSHSRCQLYHSLTTPHSGTHTVYSAFTTFFFKIFINKPLQLLQSLRLMMPLFFLILRHKKFRSSPASLCTPLYFLLLLFSSYFIFKILQLNGCLLHHLHLYSIGFAKFLAVSNQIPTRHISCIRLLCLGYLVPPYYLSVTVESPLHQYFISKKSQSLFLFSCSLKSLRSR